MAIARFAVLTGHVLAAVIQTLVGIGIVLLTGTPIGTNALLTLAWSAA